MIITKTSQAGTLESNDIVVKLMPNPEGTIQINLQSVVFKQFGKQIKALALQTLENHGITSCICDLDDKGALDYVIQARIESAIQRNL
ncbi:MAG: citrate lyase acyl carrier protein [Erysipelothrix sp.]|jgi:citrate lyase subunit gamma (acyl carrier protein)|nr:citrate lyase acyl carrier protein [Erysipelothrix sp.]